VTITQEFELPAIKMNKDKVEVIPIVRQTPPSDLITQLSTISDKFECAFNDKNSLVASVIIRLEKIEGKRVVNNIPNDLPHVDSQGVFIQPHWQCGTLTGFYPGQSPLPKLTPVKLPQDGLTTRLVRW
jgi:hypothetical protein